MVVRQPENVLAGTNWMKISTLKRKPPGTRNRLQKKTRLEPTNRIVNLKEIVWTHLATSEAQRWFCSIVLKKQRIQTESKRCITGVYLAILTRQMDWRAPENIWRSFYNWTYRMREWAKWFRPILSVGFQVAIKRLAIAECAHQIPSIGARWLAPRKWWKPSY